MPVNANARCTRRAGCDTHRKRTKDILAHFLIDHGNLNGFVAYLVQNFDWRRFTAIQVWLMVLFALYVTLRELGLLFGGGELYRLFFRWHTTQAKLTRRNRIRLLVRLNRLTENNPISAMSEKGSPANDELVRILQSLARSSDMAHADTTGWSDR